MSPDILLDLVKRELDRRRAEESLYEFVKQAWHVVEPGVPFVHGWHLEVICEHLEAVSAGEIKRLLINIPPRHAKSTIVSVMWPMWEWIAHPSEKFLCASYSGVLSTRDNIKCRRLIQSPWYQERWGHMYQLSGDQNQKTRFENDQTGYRIATSVGGTATGEGGSRLLCLHPDTLIQCSDGLRKIVDVVDREERVKVLGYDHESKSAMWCDVDRFERTSGRRMLSINTSSRSVTVTFDHPVYVVGRGYIDAEKVKPGDRLVSYLPKTGEQEAVVFGSRENSDLQQGMCCGGHTSVCHRHEMRCVRCASEEVACAHSEKHSGGLLQPRLSCQGSIRGKEQVLARWKGKENLPDVREGVDQETKPDSLLLSVLRIARAYRRKAVSCLRITNNWVSERCSRTGNMLEAMFTGTSQHKDEGGGKREIRPWKILGQVFTGLSLGSRLCAQQGQDMQVVWNGPCVSWFSTACPSYRLQQGQQSSIEPDITVQVLPWDDARRRAVKGKLDEDAVISIEEAKETEYVFNIAVKDTHNYFAGGLLLHNCDDPHGAQDAQSDAIRESAIEWWDMVWSTRLNDPKRDAMVTIMQRLHEGDVSGRILERGGWEHICLPAEYDGVKRSTVLGNYDHRERVGQLLWDQRFGPEEMQRLKESLGEYGTSGQLQQQPSPPGGGILKVKYFQKWRGELPAIEYILQSYDTAFTEKTDGDPTSCSVWGVFMTKEKKLAALLLDCWSDHLSYPELRRRVVDDWSAEYAAVEGKRRGKKPDAIVIEKKGSGQSLLQDLHVANIPAHPYDPGRADKIARAHLAAPMLELELFYILESTVKPGQFISWAQPLVDQCAKFPNVIHDDMVDTFTQAAIYLRDGRWLEMQNFEGDPIDEIDYNARKKRLSNPYAA